jgi:hypothetical protein
MTFSWLIVPIYSADALDCFRFVFIGRSRKRGSINFDDFSRELAYEAPPVFVRPAVASIAFCTALLLAAEHRRKPSQLSPRTTASALLAGDDAHFL